MALSWNVLAQPPGDVRLFFDSEFSQHLFFCLRHTVRTTLNTFLISIYSNVKVTWFNLFFLTV